MSQSASVTRVALLVEPGGQMDGERGLADAALGICDDDIMPGCIHAYRPAASLLRVSQAGRADTASGWQTDYLPSGWPSGWAVVRQVGRKALQHDCK